MLFADAIFLTSIYLEEVRTDVFDTVGFDESGGNLLDVGRVVFKYGHGLSINGIPLI